LCRGWRIEESEKEEEWEDGSRSGKVVIGANLRRSAVVQGKEDEMWRLVSTRYIRRDIELEGRMEILMYM
jgi:hypothetical protein